MKNVGVEEEWTFEEWKRKRRREEENGRGVREVFMYQLAAPFVYAAGLFGSPRFRSDCLSLRSIVIVYIDYCDG